MKEFYYKKEHWSSLDKVQTEKFVNLIFNHYKSTGFPHHKKTTPNEQLIEIYKMTKYLEKNKIIQYGIIKQTMHCLSLAWSYFPHAFSIKCNNKNSPLDVFNDDELFKKAIRKRLKSGTYINDSGIRKALKVVTGAQAVSNFRPSAACAIYNEYLPMDGVTWDMSAGFGGRLLGALASNTMKKYIGTDPSTLTFKGLVKMKNNLDQHNRIELYEIGSEDFIPNEKVDLCFTSPPYFDTEKYSTEITQSYIKFPTKNEWLSGFVGVTLDNCRRCLKPDGRLLVNVQNVKSYPNLVDDFLVKAKQRGFVHEKTLQYSLSSMFKNGYKYEPIFVLK